jgi:26S proteasome regulatory subunit T5
MAAANIEAEIWGEQKEGQVGMEEDLESLSLEELKIRTRRFENDTNVMKREVNVLRDRINRQTEHVKDNREKVKLNKVLPYLVSNVVEIIDPYVDHAETGGAKDANTALEGKGVVVKTSTRQTVFLPVPGLVHADEVKPGELVGVNKDSYIMLEKLPNEYDARVKAMEVDEKPQEDYTDVGGLDKQIQELIEAVVLPMTHAEKFTAIGITAPKGVLLYGPPGTG